MSAFWKYHGLGNDYVVVEARQIETLSPSAREQWVIRACDRRLGIGSDGVLLDHGASAGAGAGAGAFRLEIHNPDGSAAEKSGNGLRIYARYLFDRGLVGSDPFPIDTAGGRVWAEVSADGGLVVVDMGCASFRSVDIPILGEPREVLLERLQVLGDTVEFSAVTVGNPHCVVFAREPDADIARRLGPALESHPLFPNRTNVQFVEVLDRNRIRIEIWERGAGYTLASGSSSCAAAAVARRLGYCDDSVEVCMPGGSLLIELGPDFCLRMRGPVTKVAEGTLSSELFAWRPPFVGRGPLA